MFVAASAAGQDCFAVPFDFHNAAEVFATKVAVPFLALLNRLRLVADILDRYACIEFDTVTCLV